MDVRCVVRKGVEDVGHWFEDPPQTAELPATVARYARGRDYHRILPRMLNGLCEVLTDVAESRKDSILREYAAVS